MQDPPAPTPLGEGVPARLGDLDTTPVRERLRATRPALTPAERRVADAILLDPRAVVHLTVTELADLAGTSPASVVRLAGRIGLRGYLDLKIRLASESRPRGDGSDGPAPAGVESRADHELGGLSGALLLQDTARAIGEAAASLDGPAFDALVETVARARRIVVTGVGLSAPHALGVTAALVAAGVDAQCAPDVRLQCLLAGRSTAEDVVLAVSHSGESLETLAVVRAGQASGASIAAVTGFARSTLARQADVALVVGASGSAHRDAASASAVVQVAVLDALVAAVERRRARPLA
ncbi:MurR/RpiR family transcriptional regulator [Frondihabitans peucedani]|uniref:MurR/RpiR family transcriptional regulator n=2 Tax=Frondihabitans peucedani TaxID=598626 RepID=A0ABP8E0A5_9MICO